MRVSKEEAQKGNIKAADAAVAQLNQAGKKGAANAALPKKDPKDKKGNDKKDL